MTIENSNNDSALWRTLFDSENAFIEARMKFMAGCTDKVMTIRKAFVYPEQRGAALRLLPYFKVEECQQLFDDLVTLASVSHSDISLCREAILSLPRDWVLANIENSAEKLLKQGEYEEFKSLLELYIDLDQDLAYRLAKRALQNADPDIREAGEDFIKQFKKD